MWYTSLWRDCDLNLVPVINVGIKPYMNQTEISNTEETNNMFLQHDGSINLSIQVTPCNTTVTVCRWITCVYEDYTLYVFFTSNSYI